MIPTRKERFFFISMGYSLPCAHILSINANTQVGTVICGTHDIQASVSLKDVLAFDVDKTLNIARRELLHACEQRVPH